MILSVINLKGGVGKTTISVNLAVAFAHRGKRVCIIDTDSEQLSALKWSGQRDDSYPRVAVATVSAEKLVREASEQAKLYDLVILDGAPQLGKLANSTLIASDVVIVPLCPSALDFWAMESFLERYQEAKNLKESLQGFILLNRYNSARNVAKDIQEVLGEFPEIGKLQTTIGDRVAYNETITQGIGVTEHKDTKAKKEMEALAIELEKILF
jgi:chromosome partitioning protein